MNFETIKNQVKEILDNDNSGHATDHINRVLNLSLKFAKKENANSDVVSLIALLHDVDDYKLFGEEQAKALTNAKKIMNNAKIETKIQKHVLNELKCIGYSKRIAGIKPTTIEGQIVSDADMCDALGVNGILRTFKYSLKNNKPFFNKDVFPIIDKSKEDYKEKTADSSVCHLFEKILKLKKIMLTESGKQEAKARHQIVVDILYHLFDEDDANDWKEYLDDYLIKQYPNN